MRCRRTYVLKNIIDILSVWFVQKKILHRHLRLKICVVRENFFSVQIHIYRLCCTKFDDYSNFYIINHKCQHLKQGFQ